ncbi:MAG: uroporphyrinogen-III synthase [Halanaerobiales bacterium]|nr:uroporphyrinogen-III synthase [Halanaerobiales bacterium]
MDEKLKSLEEYHWIIFTSVNGVEYFVQRLFEKGLDVRVLGKARLAAIGSETAARLKAYGLRVDFVPNKFVAEELADGLTSISDLQGAKILLPRAQKARAVLPETLQKKEHL